MGKIFRRNNRTYYTDRKDAEERKRKGESIHYTILENAYYIIRPIKKGFWW